ncbi:MAG: hypothetical protein DIU79_03750 [Actinobacteria bacterium]|nr:MAG: hypothetical protein DIU79_03750 [Actinomycetota bacterium]
MLCVTLTAPAPARANPEAVTLSIDSSGQYWPDYRLQVRNATPRPVHVTVRQELPQGTAVTVASDGGRAEQNELVWRIRVPARTSSTLTASLTHSGDVEPLISPACAYQRRGERPYDCATASWTPPPHILPKDTTPWWRKPQPLHLALLGTGALLAAFTLWRLLRRRRSAPALATATPTPRRRRRPRAALVFGLVVVLLGVGVATSAGAAAFGAHTLGLFGKPRAAAWIGTPQSGPIGAELREAAFDITVYRLACRPVGDDTQRCLATVGVRNHTKRNQYWHASMQRAYLPTGTWVGADEAATRAANGGRDMFADPVVPGQRLLVPIAFTVTGGLLPNRLELRSGVFSAGVSVTPS